VQAQASQTQQVSGQKLEEQAKAEPIETDYSALYWLLAIFCLGFTSNLVRKVY
jgi:cobaltochelatase CobN